MITEDRAKDLGKKLYAAAASVNTPNRNARAMFLDQGFWDAVAGHIIDAIEGKIDTEPVEVEPVIPVDEPTASPDDDIYTVPELPEATDDEDDDDKPRRKRGSKR